MTAIEPHPVVTIPTRPVKFLIVDDDQVSVLAIKRALKKLKIINPVQVARDGREALDILQAELDETQVLPPYLVTLDLNMPRMTGLEFLDEVRNDPALHRLVIFVLSSSDAPADVANAYDNNIAGYIVKDNLGDSFVRALDMIDCFSKVVEFPN